VHAHVVGNGRFSTTYTFGAGNPATHRSFWFQIASLPMGDYPYAPGNSRRVTVLVGGHPHMRAARARHHHHPHAAARRSPPHHHPPRGHAKRR
jgi:hypothetical protein